MHLLRVIPDRIKGWYETVSIRLRSPELYQLLKDLTDDDPWN
jgi:hypothetical protein